MAAAVVATLASGGVESVGFLNDLISQLWDDINIAGGNLTKEIVEPMFAEMLPGPLSSLHFTKIDLGKTPIKFDRIDVQKRSEGVIKLDVDIFWDSDCDIELSAKFIGSFGISHLKLGGRMSIMLTPLVSRLPLVTAVQLSFINLPKIDINFTGLAEIAEFGAIESTIYKIIDKIIAGLLVLPNRMLVKLDATSNWYITYQNPLGFLRLTISNGSGFVKPKGWLKDVPDIYCKVRVGAQEPWCTETVNDSIDPAWNEVKDCLLSDQDQIIALEALDSDMLGSDDTMGKGIITVGELLLQDCAADIPLLVKREDTGGRIAISCNVLHFTSDLSSFTADAHAGENLHCGLLTVLIAGIKGLTVAKEDAVSCVKVSAFEESFCTAVVIDNVGVDALNPCFDAAFRVPLTQAMVESGSTILMTVLNKKKTIGTISIPFGSVMDAENAILTDEYQLGDNTAILKARVSLLGVALAK